MMMNERTDLIRELESLEDTIREMRQKLEGQDRADTIKEYRKKHGSP